MMVLQHPNVTKAKLGNVLMMFTNDCISIHPTLGQPVVSHVVKKLMKHPDTKSKLGSSLSQQTFCPQFNIHIKMLP